MSELLEIIGWYLLSSVKFIFAAIPLLAGSSRYWVYDMIIVALGGCTGVFVFTYLGGVISRYFARYHFFRISYKNLRRFVRLKNGYGLIGVALLTPIIISIPVGCILSATFEHDKWRVIRLQTSAVLLWSILLFSLKGLFNVNFGE